MTDLIKKNNNIDLSDLLSEINNIDNAAIKIQKIVRGFLIRNIISIQSEYQTKNWRKNRKWYINGKHNECEIYQRNLFEKITKIKCQKTNIRFNNYDCKMKEIFNISKRNDFFEWSENFDGITKKNDKSFYVNFKFICDDGGAQIRALREVYHFIHSQINYLNQNNLNNNEIYFINILDGDTCNKYQKNMKNLLKNINNDKKDNIFIGDLYNFEKYWKKNWKNN
jgi:hypothetical protein